MRTYFYIGYFIYLFLPGRPFHTSANDAADGNPVDYINHLVPENRHGIISLIKAGGI
jgi:hypothetical protein